MELKVTTRVSVENVEIGVADKDQTVAARTTKYVYVCLPLGKGLDKKSAGWISREHKDLT